MKHCARIAGTLALSIPALCWSPTAAAQSSPPELTIGTVRTIATSAQEQRFSLQLGEGQGVVIDLTPLQLPAEAVGAAASDAAGALQAVRGMRVLDPANACVRASPERPNCLIAGQAQDIEYQAGDGALRLAVRPSSAGRYTVAVTAPADGSVGGFELLVRERELPKPIVPARMSPCTLPPVARDVAADSSPAADPCAKQYTMDRTGKAYFEFDATEPGQWVQIGMTSEVLDSFVQVLGPLGDAPVESAPTVGSDDDSGGNLNALLRARLPGPGRYVVMASSLSGMDGPYALAVRRLPPPPPRQITRLQLGTPVTDSFAELEDQPYHEYTLEGNAGTTVLVEMTSMAIDSKLEAGIETPVIDASSQPPRSFASLAYSDDSCTERDARLLLRFEHTGVVTIQASSVGSVGPGAEYTIVARQADSIVCPEATAETYSDRD